MALEVEKAIKISGLFSEQCFNGLMASEVAVPALRVDGLTLSEANFREIRGTPFSLGQRFEINSALNCD